MLAKSGSKSKKKKGDNFYKLLGNGYTDTSSKKLKLKLDVDSNNKIVENTLTNFNEAENKSDSYLTLIKMLKTDLIQMQDMINSNTNDIKMFKLLSKAPGLSKKLKNIEETKKISQTISKIEEESKNFEGICKKYQCNDEKELIQKIFLELSYNELLVNKIYDFFILMKLNIFKDDSYQESLSKILPIKSFVDDAKSNLDEKKDKKNNSDIETIILSIKNLEYFFENNENKDNKIILHIIKLIKDFFNKTNNEIIQEINNIGIKYGVENKEKSEINIFNELKLYLLDTIKKYKSLYEEELKKNSELTTEIKNKETIENNAKNQNLTEIADLQKKFEEEKNDLLTKIDSIQKEYKYTDNDYNSLKEENEKLLEEIEKLKKEKDEAIAENNNNDMEKKEQEYKDLIKEKEDEITTLKSYNESYKKKINDLNKEINDLKKKNNELDQLSLKYKNNNYSNIMKSLESNEKNSKKLENDLISKYNKEIKDIEDKYNKLESLYKVIVLEKKNLEKNILYLKGKYYDPDSYEAVLKEQFETMRSSFMAKIDELNEELSDIKRNSRIKIYQLENELKESNRIKNTFLSQILSLQARLENQ